MAVFLELYRDKKGKFDKSWWPPIRRHQCETEAEAAAVAQGHLEAHPNLTCIVMDEAGNRKRL